MRALLAALLLLLPLAPVAEAQEAKPLLTDATGDVVLSVGPRGGETQQPYSGPLAEQADLIGLSVGETDETLLFTLQLASLDARGYSRYETRFTWNGMDHVLTFSAYSDFTDPAGDAFRYACLMTEDDGDLNYVWCSDDELPTDESAKSFTAEVPKYVILDAKNRMPLRGDSLTGIRVGSIGSNIMSGAVNANLVDQMPDDETGLAYTLVRGDAASGHLRLTSTDRIRVSNGGATTFVFQALVINQGESDDEVSLAVSDLPDGWTATVQSPVTVPAKGERAVPVLASVPFAHDHGGFSSFNVSATSRSDANAVASMRLGVLHTPIPQPAGHHPDLYLHAESYDAGIFGAVFPYTYAYMNTEPTTGTDAKEITAWGGMTASYWYVYMNPSLQMGLDFDIERLGSITGKIMGRNAGEGTLTAELRLWDPNEEDSILLAESDSATVELSLTDPTDFQLVLTPNEDADYIPYAPDRTLYLSLRLEHATPSAGAFFPTGGTAPALLTEGWKMSLPLNEYHDKLTGATEAAGSLILLAEGPVEKTGRPGTTLTYTFQLQADAEGTYEIDVAGADAPNAALTPDGAIKLGKGEKRAVTLAVRIPAEAANGDEMEVLLFVHDQMDPSKTAIARTKTRVATSGEAAPDEEELFLNAQDADKETPGAGLALLVGAAGVALAMRRRRG